MCECVWGGGTMAHTSMSENTVYTQITHTHTHAYTYMYKNTHKHTCTYTHAHMHAYKDVHTPRIDTYLCAHVTNYYVVTRAYNHKTTCTISINCHVLILCKHIRLIRTYKRTVYNTNLLA